MLIKVNNPTKQCREITSLSARVNAGESSLTILNDDGFSADNYIVIRRMGDEQAELHQIASVSSNTLNLTSTVSRSHHIGAEIFIIPYNQLEVSRKTSKSGAYSVLGTVDIQVDTNSKQTIYDDTQGQTSYFYRVRFFSEVDGQYSSYSTEIKGSGADTSQAGSMVDIVLKRTNDDNSDYALRTEVLSELNLAYQEVYNSLIQASSEYYLTSLELPTEDFKHQYILPDNFKEVQAVRDAEGTLIKPIPRSDSYYSRGYELVGKNIIYIEDVPEPSSTSTTTPTTVLANDAYDTDGEWVASLDATNVTTDTDEFKVGTGSINFDIDVSADASNVSALTNSTFTSQDLSSYEDTGRWRMWVYLPDVTYLSDLTLRWGSSSAVYWALTVEKDYKDHAFHDGWNLVEFNWADASVTETGSPATADTEAIGYLQLRISYTANQPDDTDFRLDAVQIANTWDANSVYEVSYLKQPSQVKNEMDSFEIPEGYQYLMVDYAVAQILFRQGERDTQAERLLRRFEKKVSKFISQSAKRTRRMIGFNLPNKRGYRIIGRDSSSVTHSDGNVTKF